MKENVQLYIFYQGIWKYIVPFQEKNIQDFLLRVFPEQVSFDNNRIQFSFNDNHSSQAFLLLDSEYHLLSLSSKVPKKLLLVCIDIDILREIERGYELKDEVKMIHDSFLSAPKEVFVSSKKESKTPKKISKETFNQVIKPAIVKKESNKKVPIKVSKEVRRIETKPKVVSPTTPPKKVVPQKVAPKKKEVSIPKKTKQAVPPVKITFVRKQMPSKMQLMSRKVQPVIPKKVEKKAVEKKQVSPQKAEKKKDAIPSEIHMVVSLQPTGKPVVTLYQKEKQEKKESVEVQKQTPSTKPKQNNEFMVSPQTGPKKEVSFFAEETIVKEKEIDNSLAGDDSSFMVRTQNSSVQQTPHQQANVSPDTHSTEHDSKLKQSKSNTDLNQGESQEQKNENGPQMISYTIISPDNKVLYQQKVECEKPMTVIDFLLQTGLDINRSNDFIQSINGISNQGMSGWVFEVNNAPVMVPASQYIMNPNEQITWKYVDFSKMMNDEKTTHNEGPKKK